MNKSTLENTLVDSGLSENEARVYLAALSLGPCTVLAISRAAGIKRTTVYAVIESLKQKGLMNVEVRGFKTLFAAQDPERLLSLLESRKEIVRKAMPDFASLYNLKGGESTIKYYEGLEGIKSVYEDLIKTIRPHEDYSIISNQGEWYNLDKKFFQDFTERRAKLPINIRLLSQDSPTAREFAKFARNYNMQIKFLPEGTNLVTNLVVVPERVVIHQLTAPISATVIENKSAIQMHQQFFELMWNSIPD
ncbi:MAG: helix-turn-helix domain-containing protein [Candidatus Paceibacterota bacterium]